jgi:predicted ArsR family transcriptional regulator
MKQIELPLLEVSLWKSSYPNGAGAKSGGASLAAAQVMDKSGKGEGVRVRVLRYLQRGYVATADDIAAELGEIPGNVRPRLSQLLACGLVEKLIETGPSCNGVPQHKWKVA